jgi:hypothetical protein
MMAAKAPDRLEPIDPVMQGSSSWRIQQLAIALKNIEGMALQPIQ